MTSRERIITALNHQQPDRLPIDFGGHRSSGIAVQAYKKLREYLNLPKSELYVYDFIQQLAIIEEDVLEIVGADVVELSYNFVKDKNYWKDWELPDGTVCKIPKYINVEKTPEGNIVKGDEGQVICIQKTGCLYFEQTCFPYQDKDDDNFDDLEYKLRQIMWCRLGLPPAPAGYDEDGLKIMRENAKDLRNSTDRAIYGTFGGNLMEIGQFSFRIDNFLCELAINPERIHTFLEKLTQMHMRNLEKYLGAVGEYIDVIGFGDDLGMQTGPQISEAMYLEFFKPRHERLWKRAKEICPHIKVSLHCCGGVYPLLSHLIDAGLDVINPVQFNCAGMDLLKQKENFGDKLTFWGGGCDTAKILPSGTVEEVTSQTKNNVKIMNKNGGYVFQQVHNILADVPPQNIMAMFDAIKE